MHSRLAPACLLAPLLSTTALLAQTPPCSPCAGVVVDSPREWLDELQAPPELTGDARLYVAWASDLEDPAAEAEVARRIGAAGAVPWIDLRLTTPSPVVDHLDVLDAQLERAAELAAAAPANIHFQVTWGGPASDAREYAFLFKRAAVALGGASAEARIVTAARDPSLAGLEALYAEEIAAYADGVALVPGPGVPEAIARLAELDPGKPVVVDSLPLGDDPRAALLAAAERAAQGASLTLFAGGAPAPGRLAPLKVLAREFQGDLAYDPYSSPRGAEAWSFVRGEDLGLRVLVASTGDETRVLFSDTTLERPRRVDLETGAVSDDVRSGRGAEGVSVVVDSSSPALLLALERPSLAEMAGEGGLVEELTVAGDRTIPVEEILRRLQAREDAQDRALETWSAVNTTHLRFQSGTGVSTVEATFEGPYFQRRGEPADWAWDSFYVNGVRWRNKRIPEIPLIQPEKAVARPLEILFGRDYRYRLRGTEEVEGRDCWVVDFEPVPDADVEGQNLYQGTVWIDRSLYRRVRTRALQLGLEGEVISNDETQLYTPVDAEGAASSWDDAAYVLPLRVVSEQVFSILNGSTAVEKETLLTDVRLNPADFEERRQAVIESDTTMVRDTDQGLRYLDVDAETGERVVREGYDQDRLFLAGGVFYDDSLDYPLPLGGVNYFSFDLKGTGAQTNVFFAGLLLTGTISDPDFLGSRFDAGVDVFAIGIPFTNEQFRDGEAVPAEDVEIRPARVGLTLGHPVGPYGKVNLEYGVAYSKFGETDDTDPDFVLPEDNLTHTVGLSARYNRSGWRLRLAGDWNHRSSWEPWGLPGEPFDPDTQNYTRWSANLAKNVHLPKFQRIGFDVDYVDGRNLDRFSKYGFGFFSDVRVHGFQSAKVRAESAYGAHGSYGFELGEVFRLELVADAVWATDEESGLENDLLAGTGLVGQFLRPWQTIVQIDLSVPVEGDDGFTLFLAFLKLFR
ncbi:MAG: hypothetical protein R2991_12340 [Thermoanaerobaculia bacterium]